MVIFEGNKSMFLGVKMSKKVAVMVVFIFLMLVFAGCEDTELYRELRYEELQPSIREWVDIKKDIHRFSLYQIHGKSGIDSYYFMFSVDNSKGSIVVKTIIVEGNQLKIYLEDQQSWLEDGKDLCIIRIRALREVKEIAVIYNNEYEHFDSITVNNRK